ncbi:MAG: YraN family protein [Bdellovibrionota bacterium]
MTRFNQKLLIHRFETPYAEVDLVFRSKTGLVLIEVKSFDRKRFGDLWHTPVISRKQLVRLYKAREYLSIKQGMAVELLIAVVSHQSQEIEYFNPAG